MLAWSAVDLPGLRRQTGVAPAAGRYLTQPAKSRAASLFRTGWRIEQVRILPLTFLHMFALLLRADGGAGATVRRIPTVKGTVSPRLAFRGVPIASTDRPTAMIANSQRSDLRTHPSTQSLSIT